MGIGASDYTGYVNGNNIGIERRASLRPLRWRARCQNCLTTFQLDHSRVEYAKCPNKSCGREARTDGNHSLANTAQVQEAVRSSNAADAREFHRDNAAIENNTAPRKKSLRDGYFTPPQFTNDRDRQSYRDFREEFDEEQTRPLREAEQKFQDTANKLARLEQDAVANRVDPEFYLKPEEKTDCFAAQGMFDETLAEFNAQNRDVFFHTCPDYVRSKRMLRSFWRICSGTMRRLTSRLDSPRSEYSSEHS